MSDKSYSASCPTCGYEHDFLTKKAMEREYLGWTVHQNRVFEKAMDGLSIALTENDKAILRRAAHS